MELFAITTLIRRNQHHVSVPVCAVDRNILIIYGADLPHRDRPTNNNESYSAGNLASSETLAGTIPLFGLVIS